MREIRHLGGENAVTPRPLVTEDDLQRLFRRRRAGFTSLLRRAGWEGRPADLLRAIANGEATERTFPVGGKLQWMAYGQPGGIGFLRDVVWAAEQPFEAFEVRLESNGWQWVFIVPKACGNLALFSRAGTAKLAVSLSSGELRLTDPEGKEVVVRAGESTTVSAEKTQTSERRGEGGVETEVGVKEGELVFRDYGHPISVTLGGGNKVRAAVTPEGQLAFSVPATNPEPLPIQLGDATGTLSAGSAMEASFDPSATLRAGSFSAEWIPAVVARRSGVAYPTGVLLVWEATLDPDHVGFNLYRARGEEEPMRVNERPLLAEGRSDQGAAYRFEDNPPRLGVYRYWLESVDTAGHVRWLDETVEVRVSR